MYNISQVIRLLLTDLKNWVIKSDDIKCEIFAENDNLTNTLNTMNTRLEETFQEANSNISSIYNTIGTSEDNFEYHVNLINSNINAGITNIDPEADTSLSCYDKINSVNNDTEPPMIVGTLTEFFINEYSSLKNIMTTDIETKASKMQYIKLSSVIKKTPKYIIVYTTLDTTNSLKSSIYVRTVMEITNCTKGSNGIYTFTGFNINMCAHTVTSSTSSIYYKELILTENNFNLETLTSNKIPIHFSTETISLPGSISYIVIYE